MRSVAEAGEGKRAGLLSRRSEGLIDVSMRGQMIVGLADRSNLLNDEFRLIALDAVPTLFSEPTPHHAPCVASVFPEIHLVLTSAFAIVQNEPKKTGLRNVRGGSVERLTKA